MTQDFVETDCRIELSGKQFTSGGAYRQGNTAGVYISKTDGKTTVSDWAGNVIGRMTAYRTYRNNLGATLTSVWITMTDGTKWYGKYGSDWSQFCRLRLCK